MVLTVAEDFPKTMKTSSHIINGANKCKQNKNRKKTTPSQILIKLSKTKK